MVNIPLFMTGFKHPRCFFCRISTESTVWLFKHIEILHISSPPTNLCKAQKTSWWFFATQLQNMRKSNWIISPGIGVKIQKIVETTTWKTVDVLGFAGKMLGKSYKTHSPKWWFKVSWWWIPWYNPQKKNAPLKKKCFKSILSKAWYFLKSVVFLRNGLLNSWASRTFSAPRHESPATKNVFFLWSKSHRWHEPWNPGWLMVILILAYVYSL